VCRKHKKKVCLSFSLNLSAKIKVLFLSVFVSGKKDGGMFIENLFDVGFDFKFQENTDTYCKYCDIFH